MNLGHRPRVLFGDYHRMVAETLQCLLPSEFEPVGVVCDGLALVGAAGRLRPDVIVADVTLPRLDGIDALRALRQRGNDARVVFLTDVDRAAVAQRALDAGASGFVLKRSPAVELLAAIRAAVAGRTYVSPGLVQQVLECRAQGPGRPRHAKAVLTKRQREVLRLLSAGYSTKEIASGLSISVRTVYFYKYAMMEVLRLRSSAALIQYAVKEGLVARPGPGYHGIALSAA